MDKVTIFGDSVLKGVYLPDDSFRYRLLPESAVKRFEKEYNITIDNRSAFGHTSLQGLEDMREAFANHDVNADYCLIEFGGNDCNYNWDEVAAAPDGEHFPTVSLDDYKNAMREMVALVRANGITPVITSLPPIDAERFLTHFSKGDEQKKKNILHWLGDVGAIYRYQEMYSDAATRIAMETGCMYIDARSDMLNNPHFKACYCRDGMHLNQSGHEFLYRAYSRFYTAFMRKKPSFA